MAYTVALDGSGNTRQEFEAYLRLLGRRRIE